MPYTPTSGRYAKVASGADVASPTYADCAAIDWKLDLDAKTANASNFRDGRKRKATLPDGTLTMTLVWDQDDPPIPGFKLGEELKVQCYVDGDADTPPASFFLVPVIVSKISPASAVEGEVVKMPVTCELNGDITYPA